MAQAPDGFTRRIFASGGCYDLDLMIKPDSELDGTFPAFDLDSGEKLHVNGWLFEIEG